MNEGGNVNEKRLITLILAVTAVIYTVFEGFYEQ